MGTDSSDFSIDVETPSIASVVGPKTREMTYSEWDEKVASSPRAKFDYDSNPPKLVVVDPTHKSNYSCSLDVSAFGIGLFIGFITGGSIMAMILWM